MQGSRWRVGSGHNIHVWNNPWLRNDPGFYVETQTNAELSDIVVSDLMVADRKEWDIELSQELFHQRDVNCISRLLLTLNDEDALI